MRRKLDFYPTASFLTEALLKHIPQIGGSILEPCSGEDDITNVLKKYVGNNLVSTNDINQCRPDALQFDAREPELYMSQKPDWVITNPPFSDAFEILQQGHTHAVKGVAFLVRLSFLEPTYDRGPWLAANPPNYVIVLPRYSFTQNGKTDSVTCCWLVWEKGNSSQKLIFEPKVKRK